MRSKIAAATSQWFYPAIATVVAVSVAILFVGPQAIGLTLVGLSFVVLSVWRPTIPTVASIVFAFAALPTWIPRDISAGGSVVQLYEVTLTVAAVAWLIRGPHSRSSDLTAVGLLALIGAGGFLSVMSGISAQAVIVDLRQLAFGAVAVFVAGRAWRSANPRAYFVALAFTLWLSASLTIAASVSGLDLGQRELGASLDLTDSGAATRLVTEATYPAVAIITATLCLFLLKKLHTRAAWHLTLPATIIVVLSFSRNPILSIALAVPIAIFLAPHVVTVTRAVKLLAISAGLIFVGMVLTAVAPESAVSVWISAQTTGVITRVVEGILAQAIATDSSAQYRAVQENPYLFAAIADSPALGHGFGYTYKPLFTGRYFANPEDAIRASRYAHQFYFWLAAKIGIGGLVVFLALTITPAFRALSRRHPSPAIVIGMAVALLGMFAQSFVAPMPIGSPTGVLFGALVGAVAAGARSIGISDSRALLLATPPHELAAGSNAPR